MVCPLPCGIILSQSGHERSADCSGRTDNDNNNYHYFSFEIRTDCYYYYYDRRNTLIRRTRVWVVLFGVQLLII